MSHCPQCFKLSAWFKLWKACISPPPSLPLSSLCILYSWSCLLLQLYSYRRAQLQLIYKIDTTVFFDVDATICSNVYILSRAFFLKFTSSVYRLWLYVTICCCSQLWYFNSFWLFYSTIGFGDITPDHPRFFILSFMLVFVGLAFLSAGLTVIQQILQVI